MPERANARAACLSSISTSFLFVCINRFRFPPIAAQSISRSSDAPLLLLRDTERLNFQYSAICEKFKVHARVNVRVITVNSAVVCDKETEREYSQRILFYVIITYSGGTYIYLHIHTGSVDHPLCSAAALIAYKY